MTTATAPVISREILEDRWRGLVDDGEDLGELGVELTNVLGKVIIAVARNDDDRAAPGSGTLEIECLTVLHDRILDGIVEIGLARRRRASATRESSRKGPTSSSRTITTFRSSRGRRGGTSGWRPRMER